MQKSSMKKGFTLIELIVVIAILGILAVVTVPKMTGFQDKARIANDLTAVAAMQNAVELYQVEVGHYPTTADEAVTAVSSAYPTLTPPQQTGIDQPGFYFDTGDHKVKVIAHDSATAEDLLIKE